MRVAYVVPTISRVGAGVSEIARLTAKAIAEVPGFEVEVFAIQDKHFEEDLPTWGDIPVHGFRYYGPSNYGFAPELSKRLVKQKADIIHVHALWMYHCFAALRWADTTGGKYIVTPHGMLEPWIMSRSPKKKSLVSALYQERFLKNASMLHLGSEKEGGDIRTLYGELPMEVIPNYVPSAPASGSLPLPTWYKPEYEGKDIYLFLSRIHEKKGCLELLEAWDKHCGNDPSFAKRSVLVFCGWLDGIDDFQQRVDGVAAKYDNIIYAGPQYGEEKQRSYAATTFVILPSKSEGLPIAILEAWSAGTVVLMTDECNLKDGFEKGAAVRIGPTVPAIIQGLVTASGLPESEREQYRTAGQRLVEDKYSKRAVTAAFVNLYRSLVSQ